MKPVFIEENLTRLKALIAEVAPGDSGSSVYPVINSIEEELKAMQDLKESSSLIILISILLVPLSIYLLYKGYYWPSLIFVAWIGAVLYYMTNEKSLHIETLREKAKIIAEQPNTKINYLLSGISQKTERINLIKWLNIAFWPFIIFMGQLFINRESPLLVLWLILAVIALVNAIFWIRFFKPQETALNSLSTDLHQLNYNLLLAANTTEYKGNLFTEEKGEEE